MRTRDRLDDHAWRIKTLEDRVEHLQKRLVELGVFKVEPEQMIVTLSDSDINKIAARINSQACRDCLGGTRFLTVNGVEVACDRCGRTP